MYCYLNDCGTYPTTYFVSEEIGYVDGPYDCSGYCFDTNNDGIPDDFDGDDICDLVDNCPEIWNPGQIDSDADGVGDSCEDSTFLIEDQMVYSIFPNPFSDYTTIKFANGIHDRIDVQIFESSGRLVYETYTNTNFI